MEKTKKINGINEWDVKDAMRTLQRAHEIKKDPKLMKAIAECAKEQMAAMASIVSHSEDKK